MFVNIGNVTERIVCASDGSVLDRLRSTYEFDAVGSWSKQTELIRLPAAGPQAFACTPAAETSRMIIYAAQD